MPQLESATPVFFVRDVNASAKFFEDMLGFSIDFLYGSPPFYGSVSRDGARFHLRFVHEPVFAEAASHEESLIVATIRVDDVRELFAEYEWRGVTFAQPLTEQPWGGIDFQVRDPDGNTISFVT